MSNQESPTLPEPIRRVIAGADVLDQVQPGWVDLIDLDVLDIAVNDRCVLGQLGAHLAPECTDPLEVYHVAVDAYRLDVAQLLRFGFIGELDEIPALTAAWEMIVEARRVMARINDRRLVDAVLAVA